jgi:hypothetical protein
MTHIHTLFELARFIGLLLLWIMVFTMIKDVFHIPIETNVEIGLSILAVAVSALLSYPLQIIREED